MRVAVVGAGIVGVCTAHELAAQGLAVSVFERLGSIAAEASFGHGGVLSPARVSTWTAAAAPWQLPAPGLGARAWPLRPAAVLRHAPWLWQSWRARRAVAPAASRQALHRLAQAGRERLLGLARELRLDFQQAPGLLVLLRGGRDLERARPALAWLGEWGVAHELVDAARARQLEPGLHADTPLHAAIHLPHDGAGNGRHFAHLLKAEAVRRGARFHFGTAVAGIVPGARPALQGADGRREDFDAVVVCAGAGAAALLRPLGLKLPLLPLRAHAVTAPLRALDAAPAAGPRAAVVDGALGVSITRLGQRLRVAGGADPGAHRDAADAASLRRLYRALDDWFPGAAVTARAQHWSGVRTLLPDGAPLLGDSGAPGVWLNLALGDADWTLACGSAQALADVIAGRATTQALQGWTLARLR